MEIKVGVIHAPREIVLESEESSSDVETAFTEAIKNDSVLTLTDERGRKVLVPAAKIAYLEIGQEAVRRVGFGAV
ncbi:DUF3107 domain-containing protein [Micropruina sonneratiae]|uniref:DUF3107 domain-containing protein n=1 Tax=Micropruina sonneratiae TaxID=2986940 RepID=UPI0022268A96|nr:DUF3107 domain-containing protein [Micropruina sp. KQZ13P-5]MCW3157456.1 DUF3107 domain-containing protein [Micropruina sp. KQZ13P-5]